jgi:Calcineurin-like phosphoesterase
VAGDVGERIEDVEVTLSMLGNRFYRVIWAPGNHELWWHPSEDPALRGESRYQHIARLCRSLGVISPEDPFPVYLGREGPVTIAPLFLLYDYSFRQPGVESAAEALELAYAAGIVCADEFRLHPDPYPTRAAWCEARVESTKRRLDTIDQTMPTVLVNHFPLTPEPTKILRHPEFSIWCGTTRTADWHRRYRAQVVVYGHLHIPRTTFEDGVRFEEVSLGYPAEWRSRQRSVEPMRCIFRGVKFRHAGHRGAGEL